MFDDDYAETAVERDKKQKIRNLMRSVTREGERAIRSVKLNEGRFYVDLFNIENLDDLNLLLMTEIQRLQKSKTIIKSLKRIRHKVQIQGQLTLEDLYSDAQ